MNMFFVFAMLVVLVERRLRTLPMRRKMMMTMFMK